MATLPPIPAQPSELKKPSPWLHFVAGGLGGMCGAIVTSPFDVVKTRLQSDLFRQKHPAHIGQVLGHGAVGGAVGGAGGGGVAAAAGSVVMGHVPRPATNLLYNFVETGYIIRDIYREESLRALFKGLGPTLVGVIPARSINFFTYGNGKRVIADKFNDGRENSLVHLAAAAVAGIVTGTATNPIWVVKTRLQLAQGVRRGAGGVGAGVGGVGGAGGAGGEGTREGGRVLGGSWACIKKIFREEGVRGFYKGLSASYLGVTEGTIQWVLYERLKKLSLAVDHANGGGGNTAKQGAVSQWAGMLGSAGTAKFVASLITYPHEVLRTRLRQPSLNGVLKYTGLLQTLQLVVREEGARALYSGLSAHLMRVVPNAAVMYSIYEGLIRWYA